MVAPVEALEDNDVSELERLRKMKEAVEDFLATRCPRFDNRRECWHFDTDCTYKDFCPNCKR